jgi:hypothetical protein
MGSPPWSISKPLNLRRASGRLYQPGHLCHRQKPSYDLCFHDTTVGNNFWPGSPTNFFAVPGYDLCTGWGTPTGSNLINALAPPVELARLVCGDKLDLRPNGNGVIDFDECNEFDVSHYQ